MANVCLSICQDDVVEADYLKHLVEKSHNFAHGAPAGVVTSTQKRHNNDLNVRLVGDIEDFENGNTVIARIFAQVI